LDTSNRVYCIATLIVCTVQCSAVGTWGILTPDYETTTIKINSIADQHLLDATQTEIPCDLLGCEDVLSKQGRSRNLNTMPTSKFMQARGCLTALRYYQGLWVKYCQNLRSSFMVLIPFLGYWVLWRNRSFSWDYGY
jgi:hypothetical protein